MANINLGEHQLKAIEQLKSGSILCGGTGSGKSRTGVAYYFIKECKGKIKINNKGTVSKMETPKDLYIITTAKKRDSLEWESECAPFMLSRKKEISFCGVKLTVDSWNNIHKYVDIKNAFFIFDEQRLVGSGTWVKSFIKITKNNRWILLTATPGDTWMDYLAVFIANGFYRNRTEFIKRHVIYNRFSKYPKIDRYIEVGRLEKIRSLITVDMPFERHTTQNHKSIFVKYDKEKYDKIYVDRWNVFENKPIKNASELCYAVRKLVNIDESRISSVKDIIKKHNKIIIFYNFNYELDILRQMCKDLNITYSEWNGHKHEPIPKTDKWIYLVQYMSGCEGWNCIETNVIIFYSQHYSYKVMKQAEGRIDRFNTPFSQLYYYHVRSTSTIDNAILKALKNKRNFNENSFASSREKHMV